MSPAPLTFATPRTQIGIAKEATPGTPVAATAFIPMKKFEVTPKQVKQIDNGYRGSMGEDYGIQNTVRSAEISCSGDVFADTIGYLLNGVLGDLATTGVSAPFTHKIALLNSGSGQPVSYTLTDNQAGLQARQLPGTKFTEVNLKWDPSGLMSYDAKALSWISGTAATPTASYGTLIPVANWLCALKFGGVAVPNVSSGEITIKRKEASAEFTLGAQDPYAILVGNIEVTGKFTFIAADESPYLAYVGNNGPGVVTALFSQSANASINFQMSNVQYDDAKVSRGKQYAEIETSWRAILNSTDAGASAGLSPSLITLIDSLPAGTFG